jgi:Domain of unknown function (DUF397)
MPLFGGSEIIRLFGCPKFDGSKDPEFHQNPPYGSSRAIFTISTSLRLKLSKRCSTNCGIDVTQGFYGYSNDTAVNVVSGPAVKRPDSFPIFSQHHVPCFVHEAVKGRLNEEGGRMEFRRACDGGGCVEVALAEVVAVRDSKAAPDGPILRFTRIEWAEFITAVKAGKFDLA